MDSVHKIFDMKYPLWVYGHVDEQLHGVPTYLIVYSQHNTESLNKALVAIKTHVLQNNGQMSKTTITDKDKIELNALDNVGVQKLLCKVSFDYLS